MSPKGKIIEVGLEALFSKISKVNPPVSALDRFKDYPDKDALIRFFIGKIDDFVDRSSRDEKISPNVEWGLVHVCRVLAPTKTADAVEALLDLMDIVKADPLAALHDAVMLALEDFGPSALESAYRRYERDRGSRIYVNAWIWVLACLGVRDERVKQALKDYSLMAPGEAALLMGTYGDPDLAPLVEDFVVRAAEYLNRNRIDPFAGGLLDDFLASEYVDARESLVMVRDGIPVTDPDFDRRVEELDRRLLKYADFSVYETDREAARELFAAAQTGCNDPCPCGSGRIFKHCCGK